MNFLQICQTALDIADRDGLGLLTTKLSVDTDRPSRTIIRAVQTEYDLLQSKRSDWKFHWAHGTLITTKAGQMDYDAPDGIPWKIKNILPQSIKGKRDGTVGEYWLTWKPYTTWHGSFGIRPVAQGTPIFFFELPNGQFRLYPIPNDVYIIEADWKVENHKLVKDKDEPLWDEDDHDILVWLALRHYVEEFDAPELGARVMTVLRQKLNQFHNRYLFPTVGAAPL